MLLVALVMAVTGQPPAAHADDEDWQITRFDVSVVAHRDGTSRVTVDFDFDFNGDKGHGPYFILPERIRVPEDNKKWRVLHYSDIEASSSSGAPADVATDHDSGKLKLRIGNPDVDVDGMQSYRVAFTMKGNINPDVNGHDEFSWNVIQDFEVPIDNITVSFEGPAELVRTECVEGTIGHAGDPCEETVTDNRAEWKVATVDAGDGMSFTAALPAGTFAGVVPEYSDRIGIDTMFEPTPVTLGAGGAVAVIGAGGVALLARRKGRDERYSGVTPGLRPTDTDRAAITTRRDSSPTAVQFTPPAGTLPGQVGTLIDELADTRDVTATMVDLAVRGYLRLEDAGDKDTRAVRLRTDTEGLRPYEVAFLDLLMDGRESIRFSKSTSMPKAIQKTKTALYEEVTRLGWFQKNPMVVRWSWFAIGLLIAIVGAGGTFLLGALAGLGFIGVGVAVIGAAMMVAALFMPARTADGSAIRQQAEGFKLYLTTAEADQLRFEEGENIFSKYLPWAIMFGATKHWTRVCAELVNRGDVAFDTSWYVATYPLWAHPHRFADSMNSIDSSMASAASGGSGGGSSFGGGVGGGVGGMGGGGW